MEPRCNQEESGEAKLETIHTSGNPCTEQEVKNNFLFSELLNSLVRDIGHRCELAGATRTRINNLACERESEESFHKDRKELILGLTGTHHIEINTGHCIETANT